MARTYDFRDDLVRQYVARAHVPFEIVVKMAADPSELNLVCEKDGDPWPCESRELLRLYTEQQREEAATKLAEAPISADVLLESLSRRRLH